MKAFEPKKLKFEKLGHNILAQTSEEHQKHHLTSHVFSSTVHKMIGQMGMQNYEFQLMDYLVIIVGLGVLVAVIVVACVCFPPYRSDEEYEAADKKDAEERKKKAMSEK